MNKLNLKINGKEQQFEAGDKPFTIAELLNTLGIDQATVVAEVDGVIVERKNFAMHTLKTDQKIELIRFVGGG